MYSHNNLSLLTTNDIFFVKQIVENILLAMHFIQNRIRLASFVANNFKLGFGFLRHCSRI